MNFAETHRLFASASPHAGAKRLRISDLPEELRRRGELARQPQPEGIPAPPLRLMLGEVGTFLGALWARREACGVAVAPTLSPRPVMLLPGFATHPRRMRALSRALRAAGHRVCDWGLGWNLGATPERLDEVCSAVLAAAQRECGPLALVGWSLGGLFAREAAKRHPDAVALVVTMGSPFSGDLHANRAWRAYHWITGQDVATPPIVDALGSKPPVRTVALWSARDGIVHPRSACGRIGERDVAVALRCTHLGFPSDPGAIAEVLRQIDKAFSAPR
jgi:pimeloyl-ACP methyl ester carboxylesterase